MNLLGEPLKQCSTEPLTGYYRDGFCRTDESDNGTHVICAEMNNDFLEFTKTRGNNLITPRNGFPGLKEGDKWCVCAKRWEEARKAGVAPFIDISATDSSALRFQDFSVYSRYDKTRRNKKGGFQETRRVKKRFLFNPDDPKRSFDVYIDKNPQNTIHIKYKTVEDVKTTIKKLEYLYKKKLYTHKRIWQVAMIMKVRLGVIQKKKPDEYNLAKRYLHFLSERTKMDDNERFKSTFQL